MPRSARENCPMGLGQYDSIGEYYGPHTASSVFLILELDVGKPPPMYQCTILKKNFQTSRQSSSNRGKAHQDEAYSANQFLPHMHPFLHLYLIIPCTQVKLYNMSVYCGASGDDHEKKSPGRPEFLFFSQIFFFLQFNMYTMLRNSRACRLHKGVKI